MLGKRGTTHEEGGNDGSDEDKSRTERVESILLLKPEHHLRENSFVRAVAPRPAKAALTPVSSRPPRMNPCSPVRMNSVTGLGAVTM